MFKVALVAAALSAAPAAQAVDTEGAPGPAPVALPACHSVQSVDLDCALRIIDANGDGTISAAELASFATPGPSGIDFTPLHPPRSTGLDFKDAATEPTLALSDAPDADPSRRLVPALLALGALVILLRQRPL